MAVNVKLAASSLARFLSLETSALTVNTVVNETLLSRILLAVAVKAALDSANKSAPSIWLIEADCVKVEVNELDAFLMAPILAFCVNALDT